MRHWIFIILLTLSSAAAEAQKIRVRKVKGNQAVVETTGAPLRQGATYDLISQEDFGDEATANNRHYLIGLNFAMSSLKSDAAGSNNVTAIDFSTRFGWNFGNFEIGPVISYSTQIATVTATTYKLGGFADYNMIPNIPGEAFIYGLGGIVAFGQHDPGGSSVNGDLKYDLIDSFVGPFVKWFPTSGPFGFRVDAGYFYERQNTITAGTITVSGFSSSVGIFTYF